MSNKLELTKGARVMLSESAPIVLQMNQGNLAVFTVLSVRGQSVDCQHDRTGHTFTASREHLKVISAKAAMEQGYLYSQALRQAVERGL